MSDTAKLSWLILGREPDGLGRTDAALLQRAALGVLAGEEAGATDKLTSALGLDELSVSQTDGETRDTVVTLGKQLEPALVRRLRARPQRHRRQLAADLSHRAALHAARASRDSTTRSI